MERIRQTVLQLDLTSDRQLVPGTVRASDGKPHPFSGWSELFAVLQRLLPEPGGITKKVTTGAAVIVVAATASGAGLASASATASATSGTEHFYR